MITIDGIVSLIRERKSGGKTVFVCGNGGSATTAEHFTNDLFSAGVKAVCLSSNTAIMTMISNDFGYEDVFWRQLELYADNGDLLIVFSGSGNSANIVKALRMDIESVALLGKGGGEAANFARHSLIIDSDDYGKIEDRHLAIAHRVAKKI